MEETLGHRFALHQTHGSRVAIGQHLRGILRRNQPKARCDARDGLIPTDPLETPLPLLADAPQWVQQAIRVVGSLGIACHFGTEDARGWSMLGGSRDLESNTVLDV